MSWIDSARYHHGLARAIGTIATARTAWGRRTGLTPEIVASWNGKRIFIRPNDSDPVVASHILGWEEYSLGPAENALRQLATSWREQGQTPVIIDGGANVGYSSLFFAQQFPMAVVIAVEPSLDSLAMLHRNCAGSPNIIPVHAAIWSHKLGVSLKTATQSSWADRVEEGGDTPSLTLEDLLVLVPKAKPLIIKLDIEGAEREVCAASPGTLRVSPCIVIEPHDWLNPGLGCLTPLYDAVRGRRLDTLIHGENLILIESELLRSRPASGAIRAAAHASA